MRISKTLMTGAVAAVAVAGSANAALIAAWDFETTTNGGTRTAQSQSSDPAASPNRYTANFGTGTLYLDGTNFSSSFTQTSTDYQITAFATTPLNADASIGMSTENSGFGFGALALRKGNLIQPGANGKGMVFKFSMSGMQGFSISYATSRPSSSGFNSHVLEFSTDGSTWSSLGTFSPLTNANFAVASFTTAGLDGAAVAYVRLKVSGATSTAGDNRFDNFILSANAVPAPGAMALLGAVGLAGSRRRR